MSANPTLRMMMEQPAVTSFSLRDDIMTVAAAGTCYRLNEKTPSDLRVGWNMVLVSMSLQKKEIKHSANEKKKEESINLCIYQINLSINRKYRLYNFTS